jgi:hypothetical protein
VECEIFLPGVKKAEPIKIAKVMNLQQVLSQIAEKLD